MSLTKSTTTHPGKPDFHFLDFIITDNVCQDCYSKSNFELVRLHTEWNGFVGAFWLPLFITLLSVLFFFVTVSKPPQVGAGTRCMFGCTEHTIEKSSMVNLKNDIKQHY